MVHSGRNIFGMEGFRRAEFLSLDIWETSVYYPTFMVCQRLIFSSRSGCGKKCILVRETLDISVSDTYIVAQLHDHRGR